ncbi:MAG: helix-turn-helix transcriptional regulator [Flavobacteriaceae bacterium]
MKQVVERIKSIRKEKGYSHEYMGTMLDISQVAYSNIEKQETKLTVERLFQIAEILETPVSDLLEASPNNVYNQTYNHDNVTLIAHQEVENLFQDNKDKTEKIEELYMALLKEKDETITVLKSIVARKV